MHVSRVILACGLTAGLMLAAQHVRAQKRVGPEIQANVYTTSTQLGASVAITPGGGFVVVWDSFEQIGNGTDLFGRRFGVSGALGGEFQINSHTSAEQGGAAVGADAAGNFVAVWSSNGQDGDSWGVFGRRFDVNGVPLGLEFQVNTYTSSAQLASGVAAGAGGDFIVVWQSGQDGSGWGVFGQRYDSSGARLGGEFQVNTQSTGSQYSADIARDANGNFVVMWSNYDSGPPASWSIRGQRFAADGTRLGTEFLVTARGQHSDVASGGSGSFVVVWAASGSQDDDSVGVFGQVFDASGARHGAEFHVNTYTTHLQRSPSVAQNAEGFVVVWNSYGDLFGVFGQQFARNGIRVGPEFAVSSSTTHVQEGAQVVVDADGRFVVAWNSREQDGSSYGVIARRYEFASEQDGMALDFHADTKSDLLWYNRRTGQVFLWRMNAGTATAFQSIATVGDLNWRIVAGGDFNGDGMADLVWYNLAAGHTYLWLMNGATPIATTPVATVPDLNWQIQASGDTDGDGKSDLIWENLATGGVYVWKMNGSSIVSALPVAAVPDTNWRIIGSHDFSGDGKSDLLWRNRATGQTYVWTLNGAIATSTVPASTVSDTGWRIVAVGYFNADNKSDLVWHHQETGQTYIWTMDGGATTSLTLVSTVADLNWRVAGSGDFNGDGKSDLLWYNGASGQTYVWLMNGTSISSVALVGTVNDMSWMFQALH
jgi:hypothetical protein